MNPVLKRGMPACVRTLLTDIEPKGEHRYWSAEDEEVDPVDRDGISLPRRGTAKPGELLSPAGRTEAGEMRDSVSEMPDRMCGLCLKEPLRYTCPRCNVPYCSVACYRSPTHSTCSEEFYKESVMQELKRTGSTEQEGRRQMQEILLRLRERENEGGGETEQMLKELEEEGHGGAEDNRQILEHLSRLAEIQTSGAGNAEEIEAILKNLREIGEGGVAREQAEEITAGKEDVEEGDGQTEEDLADRLSGLDLNSLSEEQLWALLPQQDKEKFKELVKGGAIGGLVPLWRPWWETHEQGKGALMEVLGDVTEHEAQSERKGGADSLEVLQGEAEGKKRSAREKVKNKGRYKERAQPALNEEEMESANETGRTKSVSEGRDAERTRPSAVPGRKRTHSPNADSVPPVSKKIPPLRSLSSNASPLVRYSLVNALYGYTFSLCLFNGDLSESDLVQDFCQVTLAGSECLSSNRVFGSLREALDGGAMAVVEGGYAERGDTTTAARTTEAVAHILTGSSKRDPIGYCLAALSQLRVTFTQARGALSKEGDNGETRRKYFAAGKKCEFLQAWVKENGQEVTALARAVWAQLNRSEGERGTLEKEKKEVENRWSKGQGRKKGPMIVELD
ncbi:zinc finger HIT domain-containing protein 2 [Brienomyrus brachyistius]|uniref:zinc finger HIT domain-containing protein 2 n=1 Tax=Brienomyrus brachyistius TaxID=42636 RepID=UPI0020B19D7C|nr:zinc finger HIT domain-containing protein 2 [Brienomyrus brachyistius]